MCALARRFSEQGRKLLRARPDYETSILRAASKHHAQMFFRQRDAAFRAFRSICNVQEYCTTKTSNARALIVAG